MYREKIVQICRGFWSIFFAKRCVACNMVAEKGLLCCECRLALQSPLWISKTDCLEGIGMLFKYSGPLKKVMQKIKFDANNQLLFDLALELSSQQVLWLEEMKRILQKEGLVIVPIPTTESRLKQRGLEIPEILFAPLKKYYIFSKALVRVRETITLYGLNPYERKLNLEDCFATTRTVQGCNILLVDDIFTTGATMEEAAKTLKLRGAAHVYGVALFGSIENYPRK